MCVHQLFSTRVVSLQVYALCVCDRKVYSTLHKSVDPPKLGSDCG